jgi:hypothetical protein
LGIGERKMAGEKAIQIGTFILLLIGLCSLSAWISSEYLKHLVLQIAAIALSWGLTLLVLYVGFRALHWDWWS